MIDYWQLFINHYCNELRIAKNFCVIRDPDQLQTMSINMPLQTCLHSNRMKTFLIEEVFGRFSRFKYGDISPINKCKMLKHTKFHFDFCFFYLLIVTMKVVLELDYMWEPAILSQLALKWLTDEFQMCWLSSKKIQYLSNNVSNRLFFSQH